MNVSIGIRMKMDIDMCKNFRIFILIFVLPSTSVSILTCILVSMLVFIHIHIHIYTHMYTYVYVYIDRDSVPTCKVKGFDSPNPKVGASIFHMPHWEDGSDEAAVARVYNPEGPSTDRYIPRLVLCIYMY